MPALGCPTPRPQAKPNIHSHMTDAMTQQPSHPAGLPMSLTSGRAAVQGATASSSPQAPAAGPPTSETTDLSSPDAVPAGQEPSELELKAPSGPVARARKPKPFTRSHRPTQQGAARVTASQASYDQDEPLKVTASQASYDQDLESSEQPPGDPAEASPSTPPATASTDELRPAEAGPAQPAEAPSAPSAPLRKPIARPIARASRSSMASISMASHDEADFRPSQAAAAASLASRDEGDAGGIPQPSQGSAEGSGKGMGGAHDELDLSAPDTIPGAAAAQLRRPAPRAPAPRAPAGESLYMSCAVPDPGCTSSALDP